MSLILTRKAPLRVPRRWKADIIASARRWHLAVSCFSSRQQPKYHECDQGKCLEIILAVKHAWKKVCISRSIKKISPETHMRSLHASSGLVEIRQDFFGDYVLVFGIRLRSERKIRSIKDPRPKGQGIRRRDGEPFSYRREPDVGLADASKLRRKRRGMRPEEIQKTANRFDEARPKVSEGGYKEQAETCVMSDSWAMQTGWTAEDLTHARVGCHDNGIPHGPRAAGELLRVSSGRLGAQASTAAASSRPPVAPVCETA